jgi:plastocyanin
LSVRIRVIRDVVLLCAVLTVRPSPLLAQGPVSGRIAIQEKAGETTTDFTGAIVYLVPKAGAARTTETKAQIAMNGRAFVPRVRLVTPGSTVEFPNQDPFSHNIFSTAAGGAFDVGTYGSGIARGTQFRKAGIFPIYCNIHAKMSGYVVVVPTPWHAQATADGRWTIAGVPAGKYEVHAWHERTPEVVRELDVPAPGLANVDATLDARGFVLLAHKNKNGKDYDATIRY